MKTQTAPITSNIHKPLILLYARLFVLMFPKWAQRCNGRIERATRIATTAGACRMTDHPDVYEVQSESNPRAWYTVDMKAKTCTCPDDGKNQHKPTVICKHRLAIGFKLYGPNWHYNAIEAAKKAANDAWHVSNLAADTYERIACTVRPDGTYPSEEETKPAQDRMLETLKIATEAQERFNRVLIGEI